MDDRRPAQAGAQNPAYRPTHPQIHPRDLRRGIFRLVPGRIGGTSVTPEKGGSGARSHEARGGWSASQSRAVVPPRRRPVAKPKAMLVLTLTLTMVLLVFVAFFTSVPPKQPRWR
jgi:hypothetical protein